MKHINNFEFFLNEYLSNRAEEEIMDVASLELVSNQLTVVEEEDAPFVKLKQLASASEGEVILDIVGHQLTIYREPIEFILWLQDNGVESFIVKDSDLKKI